MFDYFTLSADVLYILGGILLGIIRASGVTVESGTTGLLFTLGRIDRPVPLLLRPLVPLVRTLPWLSGVPRTLLEPGFHPMIPFLQRARRVPTRSRTLDLPAQKVATFEGYVFVADANVVYRIVDVRRALIMVDDVVEGLKQMLTLGVQDVLRAASARELQSGEGLDEALRENLERKVVVWGVEIERAGFPTITPSPRTLRITQLEQRANERHRRMLQLVGGEGGRGGELHDECGERDVAQRGRREPGEAEPVVGPGLRSCAEPEAQRREGAREAVAEGLGRDSQIGGDRGDALTAPVAPDDDLAIVIRERVDRTRERHRGLARNRRVQLLDLAHVARPRREGVGLRDA